MCLAMLCRLACLASTYCAPLLKTLQCFDTKHIFVSISTKRTVLFRHNNTYIDGVKCRARRDVFSAQPLFMARLAKLDA